MRAIFFALTSLERGQITAVALLCPEARYAAIRWVSRRTIDRRYIPDQLWSLIDQQLAGGFMVGPLPRRSAISGLLTSNPDAVIEYLTEEEVDNAAADVMSRDLDDCLLHVAKQSWRER